MTTALKTLLFTISILPIITSAGCVNIRTDGDNVRISPAGIEIESREGDSVSINGDGIEISSSEGESVVIDDNGVLVNDADGTIVEVNEDGVHITGDDLDTPEDWPKEITIPDGFSVVEIWKRNHSDESNPPDTELTLTSLDDIDFNDLIEHFRGINGWTEIEDEAASDGHEEEHIKLDFEKGDETLSVELKLKHEDEFVLTLKLKDNG